MIQIGKRIKSRFIMFLVSILVLLVNTSALAIDMEDNQLVDKRKIWTITFSDEILFNNVTKQSIKVLDSNNNSVNVSLKMGQDKNKILVNPPQNGYEPGEEYILVVEDRVNSVNYTNLAKSIKMEFRIRNNYDPGDTAIFQDEKLEAVIREKINKPIGDIYICDVENITILDGEGRGIRNLEGIQYLINLEELELSNGEFPKAWNSITDVSPLSELTNLKTLGLKENEVSDIRPLSNLTTLENLYLSYNEIDDISSLKNLKNLKSLVLTNNKIDNISSLENLTNLQILNLVRNKISDISPLKNCINLQKLYLDNNEISDISSLENLSNLVRLDLDNNQISDISLLSNFTNLKKLILSHNDIRDISPLKNLSNLEVLFLCGNEIKDFSPAASYYDKLTHKDFKLEENSLQEKNKDMISSIQVRSGVSVFGQFIKVTLNVENPEEFKVTLFDRELVYDKKENGFCGVFYIPDEDEIIENIEITSR